MCDALFDIVLSLLFTFIDVIVVVFYFNGHFAQYTFNSIPMHSCSSCCCSFVGELMSSTHFGGIRISITWDLVELTEIYPI